MFELLVIAALVGSIMTGRWELIIIFGLFYVCCRKANDYE